MIHRIPEGALTALVTPFVEDDGKAINWKGFKRLIEFQVNQGISGIVPAGTTGESPTLSEDEHKEMIFRTLVPASSTFILSGCGSNSTKEAMEYVRCVANYKGKAVLLVDSYYNGPSSLELRKEYYEPIARAFPNISIVPYIIPGRTGCKLLPEDLAILALKYPNICAVKEATGDLNNMMYTRALVSSDFQIFSGDDDKTYEMIVSAIKACGVISVISNIAPAAVQKMCKALLQGDFATATIIKCKLQPLFEIVTVSVGRKTDIGKPIDKFRNPLAIKTAMNKLGMPSGPCRQPLGKMSKEGLQIVRSALINVRANSPEVFAPIEEFFGVDIDERLAKRKIWASFSY